MEQQKQSLIFRTLSWDLPQRDHYVTSFEISEWSLGKAETKDPQWIFDEGTEGTVLRM